MTAMLAAVFAHYGSSTLAWDNNPLQGTLGWRTEQAVDHDSCVTSRLSESPELVRPRQGLSGRDRSGAGGSWRVVLGVAGVGSWASGAAGSR